ncbi:MAG: fibronectin type III domain-containing protein, partial [Robiginitomaculum sp.]|nr:fibronectin type III domain-containing protein [Robiginitomaculum sp.]
MRKLKKYDSSGNHLLTFGHQGNGDGEFKNNGPFGIAIDSAGNIWVADTKAHQIEKFDSLGNHLLTFGSQGSDDTQFRQPYALAIDSFDNVWIADTNNDRIVAYDSSGNFLTKYGAKNSDTGFKDNGPRGIAFDSASSIFYVTDTKGNTIHKFQNNLTPIVVGTVPDAPTDLSASAGHKKVTLSWTAPANVGGSTIFDYVIAYSSDGGSNWTIFEDGTSTDTSETVTKLTNDTEYMFGVFAINSFGSSLTPSIVTSTPTHTVGNNQEIPASAQAHTVAQGKPFLLIDNDVLPSSIDAGTIESELDFSSLIQNDQVTVTGGTEITSTVDGVTIQLKIHGNTKITFPEGTTTFKIPQSSSTSAGTLGTTTTVIDFGGNNNERITFDTPLRLLIPGIAGNSIFFSGVDVAGNSVTSEVTTVCAADNIATVSNQIQSGTAIEECHITSGNDEIIWTTHASTWGGYTPEDNVTTGTSSSSTVTKSHTIPAGDNVIIVVGVSINSDEDISDVDWGATQLTEWIDTGKDGTCASEIWYATIGDLGSDRTDNVVIKNPSSKELVYAIMGLYGAHQTSPLDTSNGEDRENGDPSVSITTNYADSITFEQFCVEDTSVSPTAGQTEQYDASNSLKGATYTEILTDAGSYTQTLDIGDNGKKSAHSVVAIRTATPQSADTVPGTPTGLSATPGNAEVSLEWTAPSDGGSIITDYTVQYRQTGSGGSGNIIVSDKEQNTIQIFDTDGNFISKFGSQGSGNNQLDEPEGVAVDSAGNIYVADKKNHRIQIFDSSGTYSQTIGSQGSGTGQFESPDGVYVDSSGNIFVADKNNDRVQKFNPAGTHLLTIGSSGSGNGEFDHAYGVVTDSSGNIYVSDQNHDRVQKFDSSGTYLLTIGSSGSGNGQFEEPQDLAIDSSNNLYVADKNANNIQKFDSSGTYLLTIGSFGSGATQLNDPEGVAVDSSGNIYVTDKNNDRVQKYNSAGTHLLSIGSSGYGDGQFAQAYGIAVSGSSNSWNTFAHGDNTTTETVTGLINGIEYEFRVIAVNSVGSGTESSTVIETPIAGASVPGIPTNLVASAGVSEVTLTWTEPSNGGSSITDYLVEYSTDGTTWNTFAHGDNTTSETVTGLTNGQQYFFRVSAVNSIGTGDSSGGSTETVTSRVSHDDDDAEEDLEGSNAGEMYLDSSDLELTEDGDKQKIGMRFNGIAIPQGATILSADVQFTVDEVGSQDTYLSIFAEDIDNSPTYNDDDHNISSRTKTSAQVEWNPVSWNNVGAAGDDQKTPELKTIIQEVIDRAGWTDGNSLSIIISGTGQRTAESHDGSSSKAPLLVISYTVPITAPAAPVNLSATPGNQEVSLSWTAPYNGGLPITDYLIEYRLTSGGWSTFTHDASTSTSITVDGLTNDSEYEFKVSAINSIGVGSQSNIATATPSVSTTITIQISQSSDDAEQGEVDYATGEVSVTSSDLDLDDQDWVGLRFNGITIPTGSTISHAYVEFTSEENESGAASVTIYG